MGWSADSPLLDACEELDAGRHVPDLDANCSCRGLGWSEMTEALRMKRGNGSLRRELARGTRKKNRSVHEYSSDAVELA